jgi:hypothetical protein
VTHREAPYLWTITTSTPQVRAEITHHLESRGENTHFERKFTYATSGIWLCILDFLLMRRRMRRESRIALEQLKERFERLRHTT